MISIDIVTKLIKIRGVNYRGGREFHNLIVEGKKEESVRVSNCVKYPLLESRRLGIKRLEGMCRLPLIILYIVMSLADFLLD